MFRELAHIILDHTSTACKLPCHVQELEAESVALLLIESLNLPGNEYSRGYLQAWAASEDLTEEAAGRIMSAADKILRAERAP